ncbi:hypothetical protein EV360DRAFT_73121 [Lentinula raphanica]|nr:hypothetical protein EV360DRAFT_73121 [Lentinula raphanica]
MTRSVSRFGVMLILGAMPSIVFAAPTPSSSSSGIQASQPLLAGGLNFDNINAPTNVRRADVDHSRAQDDTGIDPCKQLELNPNPHEHGTISSRLPVRTIDRKVGRIRKNLDILSEYYHDYEEQPEPKTLRATIYYECLAQIKTQIENVVEEHRRAGTKWTDEEVFRESYKTHKDWVDVYNYYNLYHGFHQLE